MDQTHIHLLITHLPIFGSILGGVVLAYGLYSKSDHTKIASYYLFIISGLGAGIAYLTGEEAEETVENLQGVVRSMIEEHEDAALFALISSIILGVAAIIGLILQSKRSAYANTVAKVTLFLSLFCFSVTARTGYLGGMIRHPEVNDPKGNNESHQED
jgi:uncharacterized membrane protein